MKKRHIALAACATAAIGYYLYKENKTIESECFVYRNRKIPPAFHGSKILLVSDLHNNLFKKEQKQLIKEIDLIDPDYIFICGDLVHAERTRMNKMNPIKCFIEAIEDKYMVFYVAGNHEAKNDEFLELCDYLLTHGVYVLNDEMITIEKDHQAIDIVGVMDPRFHGNHKKIYRTLLKQLYEECDNELKILLAHRPEFMKDYQESGYDLVFSGHAHGGVIQLEKRKGIFAPNQGFFPKYCDGKYTMKQTTMFVSRGLGNASCPIRINTKPHLLSVVLEHE